MSITISLPIYLEMGTKKKKTFALNLNIYRNAYFRELNDAKVLFEQIVAKRIQHLPLMTKVDLTYRLFIGSNRAIDVANVCSIVDKFFSDTLVNQGKLPDDNQKHIANVSYSWGGVDKNDPRVEVTLTSEDLSSIEMDHQESEPEKEKPMEIKLVQSELEVAVRNHILSVIAVREGQEINVEFVATRGDEGVVAKVSIGQSSASEALRTIAAANPPAPKLAVPPTPAVAPKEPAKAAAPKPTQADTTTEVVPPKVETKAEPKKESTGAKEAVKAAVSATAPKAEQPKVLFQTPGSKPAAPAQAPAGGAKSLFANLVKPEHDPKPTANA